MKRINKGFTLMELLIVIGVLGILAAGLLAAIDPFEQLKKARDTNNRSAAIEFLSSSQRYYATHGYLPWYKQTVSGTYDCTSASIDALRVVDSATPWATVTVNKTTATAHNSLMKDCVDDTLGVDGEIKGTFFDGLATTLYVTSGGTTEVMVCFPPEGKSNISDAQTQYSIDVIAAPTQVAKTCTAADRLVSGKCLQCFE